MPRQDHRPDRMRAAFASAVVAAAALAGSLGTASAAPPSPFTLSPDPVSFTALLNGYDYQFVTLTTGNKRVYMGSPQSTNSPFFDTQTGTCWQGYGSLGVAIPARTSCTIEVGFHPTAPGPNSDTLTVTACKKWHLDPTFGFVVCDTFDGTQSVGLEGTVLILPDLVVSGITLGDGGVSPYGYRVTVQNQGDISANISGVTVQGYWSADGTTFDPDNQNPACGQSFPGGTLVGIGGSATLTVNCSAGNVSGEEYLGVEVDIGEAIVEKDETNNVGFQGLPDLIVESITIDGPSEDWAFNSTSVIKNIGVGPAVVNLVVLTVAAWYSADDTLDSGDTHACGDLLFTSPGVLAVNDTIEAHIGCAAPGAGDNYLLIEADALNVDYPVVPEIDETNNVTAISLT